MAPVARACPGLQPEATAVPGAASLAESVGVVASDDGVNAAAEAESAGASGAAGHAEDERVADATGEPAAGAAAIVAAVSALTLKRRQQAAAAAAAHSPPRTRSSRRQADAREDQRARDKADYLSSRNATKAAAAEAAAAAAAVELSKSESHAAHQVETAAARSAEARARASWIFVELLVFHGITEQRNQLRKLTSDQRYETDTDKEVNERLAEG